MYQKTVTSWGIAANICHTENSRQGKLKGYKVNIKCIDSSKSKFVNLLFVTKFAYILRDRT